MPVIGIPAFNAVSVLRIEAIDFHNAGVSMTAHGAFVSTETGKTYGKTTCHNWSKPTLDKLAELRALMEEDLARMVFTQARATTPMLEQAEPGGIGEELRGGPDAPQV